MLLRFAAVGDEGVGEGVCGGSGVGVGGSGGWGFGGWCVFCRGGGQFVRISERGRGGDGRDGLLGGERFPRNFMRGIRAPADERRRRVGCIVWAVCC